MSDLRRLFAIALLLGGVVCPLDSAGVADPTGSGTANVCRPAANRGFCRVGCHMIPPGIIQRSTPTLDRVKRPYPVGTAILEVGINETGHVVSVCVLRSVRADFDQVAQDASSRWLFRPSFLQGKPVGVVITMTMDVPNGSTAK